jgi:hypothetical protein
MPRLVIPSSFGPPPVVCLMRHQAKPRGEVAAAAEGASITDRGDQRGRVQHADARGETASGRIVARHLGELVVQRVDARIERACSSSRRRPVDPRLDPRTLARVQ